MYSPTDKQISKSMRYLKHLKNVMEASETRTKSVHFTRNLLQRQKVANCQNELDRIRGQLALPEMRGIMANALKKREETLEQLKKTIMS